MPFLRARLREDAREHAPLCQSLYWGRAWSLRCTETCGSTPVPAHCELVGRWCISVHRHVGLSAYLSKAPMRAAGDFAAELPSMPQCTYFSRYTYHEHVLFTPRRLSAFLTGPMETTPHVYSEEYGAVVPSRWMRRTNHVNMKISGG